MRKAIVYASVHHGNTEKLVKGIAEECQVDLIDAVKQPDVDLSSYDMIGFASGIYFSKFHQSILGFAEKNLPDDKKVFLICTYGGSANYKSIEQILDEKRSKVIGKFGCKGNNNCCLSCLLCFFKLPNKGGRGRLTGSRQRVTFYELFVECFVVDGHTVEVFLLTEMNGERHRIDPRLDLGNQIRGGIHNDPCFQFLQASCFPLLWAIVFKLLLMAERLR